MTRQITDTDLNQDSVNGPVLAGACYTQRQLYEDCELDTFVKGAKVTYLELEGKKI
jgi:hypothetical protein